MNKSIKRVLHLVIAIAGLAAGGKTLLADTIVFDPDGSGNSPTVNLNSFQFGAGNSLDRTALPFSIGTNFQLLFQGQLNSIITNTGAQLAPSGLNATTAVGAIAPYEITIVGSVTEQVTNVNAGPPGRTIFHLAGTQTTASFVEIYYDGNPNASPLPGTGYNDGIIILRGVPVPAQANSGMLLLTDPQPSPVPAFDAFTTNNYPAVTSATGIGATKLAIRVTGVNPAFFVAPGGGDAGRQVQIGDIISIDLSQALPFDKVNPSHLFATAPNTTGGAGPAPSATPAIGTVNGSNGADLQAQTVIAASIRAASPTPAPTPTPTVSPTVTPSPTVSPTATPTPSATISAPKVIISSNKTSVKEGNDVIITFTFRGTTTHSAITVNYTTAGTATLNTDYTLTGAANMVTIPANTATATVTLHAITDTVSEPNGETVKIALAPGTGYNVPTQIDGKRVIITIQDPG